MFYGQEKKNKTIGNVDMGNAATIFQFDLLFLKIKYNPIQLMVKCDRVV